jgi:hypothetical protein
VTWLRSMCNRNCTTVDRSRISACLAG